MQDAIAQDEPSEGNRDRALPSATRAARAHGFAVFALSLLVAVGAVAVLICAWAFDAQDPAYTGEDGVTMLSLEGSYSVDGGAWQPYAQPVLDAPLVGVGSVIVRGQLSEAVPKGERINLRLSSTSCIVRVNGERVFSFDGRSGTDPAAEPMLGWVGFISPGITASDSVEVTLERMSNFSSRGDFELTFRTMCAGDVDSLRFAMIRLFAPMFACGVAVLAAGLFLLIVASVGHLMGMPKERGGLLFACFVLLGGVWIFFCFDYITLLVPRPQFTAAVSLLAQDALALVLVGFVTYRSRGRMKRLARGVLVALSWLMAAVVVLRLAGACSLFNANTFIVPPFEIAVLVVAVAFARDARARRDHGMTEAAAVVLPCAAGAFLEGLSFLAWGVSTGFLLTAGIAVSVVVRFVALFSYARKQVALAERAHLAEQELTRSRIAITLSQIQPHFLYNALTTIQYLCTENPPLAARTVDDFARYLRGNMDSLANEGPIPFSREVEHLRHYVAIEQLRFPNVAVEFDLGEQDFLLPALTVQSLVENAIRHGLRGRADGGTVKVSSWRDPEGFHVRVTDSGRGFARDLHVDDLAAEPERIASAGDPARSHVGLTNVAYRVRALCDGTVLLRSAPGEGCAVVVTLPLESQPSLGARR